MSHIDRSAVLRDAVAERMAEWTASPSWASRRDIRLAAKISLEQEKQCAKIA